MRTGDPRLRKCPCHGCEERIPRIMFACRRHWFALPDHLRHDITAAYAAWQKAVREELGFDEVHRASDRLTAAQLIAQDFWMVGT